MTAQHEVFADGDEEYLAWIARHPGEVLNVRTSLDPNYNVLHRASCGSIASDRFPGAYPCRGYRKVVPTELSELSGFLLRGGAHGAFSQHSGL